MEVFPDHLLEHGLEYDIVDEFPRKGFMRGLCIDIDVFPVPDELAKRFANCFIDVARYSTLISYIS